MSWKSLRFGEVRSEALRASPPRSAHRLIDNAADSPRGLLILSDLLAVLGPQLNNVCNFLARSGALATGSSLEGAYPPPDLPVSQSCAFFRKHAKIRTRVTPHGISLLLL